MQYNAIRFAGTGYVLNQRRSINQSIDQSVGSDQSINRINRIGTVQLLLNGLVMATETNQTKQIHTLTLTLSHSHSHTHSHTHHQRGAVQRLQVVGCVD